MASAAARENAMFRQIVATALITVAICGSATANGVSVGVHGNSNAVSVYAPTYNLNVTVHQPVLPSSYIGQFCRTRLGIAGPGMAMPIGSGCVVDTIYGPQHGVIVP